MELRKTDSSRTANRTGKRVKKDKGGGRGEKARGGKQKNGKLYRIDDALVQGTEKRYLKGGKPRGFRGYRRITSHMLRRKSI